MQRCALISRKKNLLTMRRQFASFHDTVALQLGPTPQLHLSHVMRRFGRGSQLHKQWHATDSNGSGSVSSTGAAFGDAGSGLGLSHHAVVGSGMDAHGTTVIAALRWCVLGIGCGCCSSTAR